MLTKVKLSMGPENTMDMEEYQAEDPENKIKQIPKMQNKMTKRKTHNKKNVLRSIGNSFQSFSVQLQKFQKKKKRDNNIKKLIINMCAVDPLCLRV